MQNVYTYEDVGVIAKMIANKLRVGRYGQWLLPFWREMGGQPECNLQPALHGAPGVLASSDQVPTHRHSRHSLSCTALKSVHLPCNRT